MKLGSMSPYTVTLPGSSSLSDSSLMIVPDTGEVVSTSKLIRRAAFSFLGEGAFFAEDVRVFSSVWLPLRFRLGLYGAGERECPRSEAAGLAPRALSLLLLLLLLLLLMLLVVLLVPLLPLLFLTHRLSVSKAVKVRGEGWLASTLHRVFVDSGPPPP